MAPLRTDPWELFLDREMLIDSSHREVKCVDCHTGTVELPHPAKQGEPSCSTSKCHAEQGELYNRSVHAKHDSTNVKGFPHCWTCHGDHGILPPTERKSWTYPLNVLNVCGGCHVQHRHSMFRSPSDLPENGTDLVRCFNESEHGRGALKSGLIVVATCPDCHRAHDIQPSREPTSSVNSRFVPQTCGRCHVGVAEQYTDSIHFTLDEKDTKKKRPVCTDCHHSHSITRAGTPAFAQDIVLECGTCHEDLYATYHESYHGQAFTIGHMRAASCSDCHGAHEIAKLAESGSTTAIESKVAMCAKCHPGSNENFAGYLPHADHRDREKNPLLFYVWMYFVIVISSTFTFFGLHTVLWWMRSLIERYRHGPVDHHGSPNERMFVRFKPIQRFTHALVITSFMGLTITGLPLKFAQEPWALFLSQLLGGGNAAGILHRIFAGVMFSYVLIHLVVVAKWAYTQVTTGQKGWLFGPNSMLPRWKDLFDLIGMFKWFVGLGPVPKFDRFTYWEKFDYMADAFGTVVIGGSGLMLAFPEAVSLFLPGWVFNVAMIIHGYEALLAIAFIFTIHFFNAHLRIEKFPTDTVIFNGQISEHEFREERPLEYERLKKEGRLDELRVERVSPQSLFKTRLLGVVLLLIGITLVVLIIWAGLAGLLR
ncbi:MAG: hypothetical protein JSU63_04185 [Phycisphaerales bacterium]|nr:MAG: hypothetical protein JSU63_04185 [Phycisphaerales bacterium]